MSLRFRGSSGDLGSMQMVMLGKDQPRALGPASRSLNLVENEARKLVLSVQDEHHHMPCGSGNAWMPIARRPSTMASMLKGVPG